MHVAEEMSSFPGASDTSGENVRLAPCSSDADCGVSAGFVDGRLRGGSGRIVYLFLGPDLFPWLPDEAPFIQAQRAMVGKPLNRSSIEPTVACMRRERNDDLDPRAFWGEDELRSI